MSKQNQPRIVIPLDLRRRMVEVARALRTEQTLSEDTLWAVVRNRGLDSWKFRRQFPVGPFVVDFFCAQARLAVEVDGAIHLQQVEADRLRQALIEEAGIRFVRVTAEDVEQNLPAVITRLRAALNEANSKGDGNDESALTP